VCRLGNRGFAWYSNGNLDRAIATISTRFGSIPATAVSEKLISHLQKLNAQAPTIKCHPVDAAASSREGVLLS